MVAVVLISAPPAAAASAPSVETLLATSSVGGGAGAGAARVVGTVNAHLQETSYWVDFALAGSAWCASGGKSGTPEGETAPQADDSETDRPSEVAVFPKGLTAKETYCFELLAKNASGTGAGTQISYTEGAPAVEVKFETLRSVYEIAPRSATSEALTVSAEREENGATEVLYDVEYATASSSWCKTHGASGVPEGVSEEVGYGGKYGLLTAHNQFVVEGLTAGSEYCARPEASDEDGVNHGAYVSFVAGAPKVFSYGPYETSLTAMVVPGQINTAGQAAEYQVLYAETTETWCTSGGTSGSPKTTPLTKVPEVSFPEVHVEITGLTTGAKYCAELVVVNATAESGWHVAFEPGAPGAFVEDVFDEEETLRPNGDADYVVNASVNKRGEPTEEWVEYALASSRYCRTEAEAGSPEAVTLHEQVGSELSGEGEAVYAPATMPSLPPSTEYCATLLVKNTTDQIARFVPFTTAKAVTLTVQIEGTGSGSVTGPRISCPGSCSALFLVHGEAKHITLKAQAAAGSTFVEWTKFSCEFASGETCITSPNGTVGAVFESTGGGGGPGKGSGGGNGGPGGGETGATTLACSVLQQGLGSVKQPAHAKHGHATASATLPVAVRCNGAASLTVSATLTRKVRRRGHRSTIRYALAAVHGSLAAAGTATLTLRLPARALAALKHGARLGAKVALAAQGTAGVAHATVSVARLRLH